MIYPNFLIEMTKMQFCLQKFKMCSFCSKSYFNKHLIQSFSIKLFVPFEPNFTGIMLIGLHSKYSYWPIVDICQLCSNWLKPLEQATLVLSKSFIKNRLVHWASNVRKIRDMFFTVDLPHRSLMLASQTWQSKSCAILCQHKQWEILVCVPTKKSKSLTNEM